MTLIRRPRQSTPPTPDSSTHSKSLIPCSTFRTQLVELQQQVEALQPAFYAACAALQLEKITTDHATISRRLTPGKWDYSDEIVEQEDLLKQLKSQFQQAHEPIGGREVYWMIKFLLATV